MGPYPVAMPGALRADAERNRCALLRAALEVFAERGVDAPLDEIARRAGVGNATLYRRFPTRCSLVAAVFTDTLRDVNAALEKALAEPDGWTAFVDHVTYLGELQASNRGLADQLADCTGRDDELRRLRDRAREGTVRLIARAQESGALRSDFRYADLTLILKSNAGLLERTGESEPEAWRRHLGYVVDGLRGR
jgi:AcrR family transcriptional regulator